MSRIKNELLSRDSISALASAPTVHEWLATEGVAKKHRHCIAAAIVAGITSYHLATNREEDNIKVAYNVVGEARFNGIGATSPWHTFSCNLEKYRADMTENLIAFGSRYMLPHVAALLPSRTADTSASQYLDTIMELYTYPVRWGVYPDERLLCVIHNVAFPLLQLGYFVLNPDSGIQLPYLSLVGAVIANGEPDVFNSIAMARMDSHIRMCLIEVFTADQYVNTREADLPSTTTNTKE